jgi:hypothetical protein
MKTKLFAGLCGALLLGAGCVETVNDKNVAGVPFVKDRVEGRYDRPMEEVFAAGKKVVANLGMLVNEGTVYTQGNMVKTIEGKVNQRNVWIRMESVDPKMTAVIVQARTRAGGVDVELAHYIDKEIALALK